VDFSLEDAVTRILGAVPAASSERLRLEKAHGRVLAQSPVAHCDLPPFDNSAMDGYAVRSADVSGAKLDSPVKLKRIGKVAAGQNFNGQVLPGTCVRLFTGSPLPDGADAVVMQEDTRALDDDPTSIVILESAKPWENVRLQGEDVKKGALIGQAGELITVGLSGLMAATGTTEVAVGISPTVGLIATGSELKEPGENLLPGQIYESNRTMLAELVRRAGGIPKTFPLVCDDMESTRAALAGALEQCPIIVTSGGVSVGEMDFVKPAFEETGGVVKFWRVAVRPGRPFVFGRNGSKLFFGLPGNPVSALVTFLLLVRPAILRFQGASDVSLPKVPGTLAEPIINSGDRRHFVRVRMDSAGKVYSSGTQASHMLTSIAAANGLLDVAAGTKLAEGEKVMVWKW